MKFVLTCYGTRGDVEPPVAVGRELLRRGHDVRMAVPPDLVDFVEAAGPSAVGFGPDLRSFVDSVHNTWKNRSRIKDQVRLWRESRQRHARCWMQMSTTLMALADGADVLLTGLYLEECAANIAEYYDVPLATLHHSPIRSNSQVASPLPARLNRFTMTVREWLLYWSMSTKVEHAQRRELGLSRVIGPSSRRMARRQGTLEIQAYDEVCFPRLASEWAKWDAQRPFVGALTMGLATDADDEVASWVALGKPPICFGFGSMPVESPADTIDMISAACAQLGERALVCAGWADYRGVPRLEHVKVVGAVNYEAVFPACRAVVHHGGAGTTAASLRAGVPTLVLPTFPDQTLWGVQVDRLKVGTTRLLSATTCESLVADLRKILAPDYVSRASTLATRMTKPTESVAKTAALLEHLGYQRSAR